MKANVHSIQRAWRRYRIMRNAFFELGVALIHEEAQRESYFLLTDESLPGEQKFQHRCSLYNEIAHRIHAPSIESIILLRSVPND